MSDISKYLESQLSLAQKKCDKKSNVSQLSKTSATIISNKQCKIKNKNSKLVSSSILNVQKSKGGAVNTSCQDVASGSEYEPSSEDDEELVSIVSRNATSTSQIRNKNDLKKIFDDGDKHLYDQRLEKWKNTLKLLHRDGISIDKCDVLTADMKYLIDGNSDGDENHEVKGGLLVPKYIWKQLYKYQRSGVKWLWELHQIKSGGLLGDEMGLGKTVQLIAFLAGLSRQDSGSWGGLGPSIIVTPATVIYQWVSHFHYWFPSLRVVVLHSSGSHGSCGHSKGFHSLIRDIHGAHGVLLMTYAGIVKYNTELLSRNWHYLILDEGHKIRNPDTQVSKMVKKFKTPHKILITGSPMQNSLQELWSLFDFMSPGLLGTQTAFMEYFSVPITQGGYSNATQLQEVTAFEIAKSLKNIITPYMIRRSKAEVQEHINLPEKQEQVLFCTLSQEQRDLYLGYLLSGTVRNILDKDSPRYGDPIRAKILVAISTLRKICNHPDLYLYEACDDDETVDQDNFGHWKRSGKMIVVQSLLKIWQKQRHRALIFSQSRGMLCILEQFLIQNNYSYLKMDGTVSVGLRQNLIKTFNENSDYLVFLATTRVGGLGVNLTGADRVIIYDPDWNPATDSQAKERAWRIGQLRNVTIYRLLSAGTIEEKIYQRQVFKHLLSNKVLIDPNQKNLLKTSNLQGLFTLEDPNREGDTETASIFSHTKVERGQRKEDIQNNVCLSGAVSFSKKKIEAMRKRAREISKQIAISSTATTTLTDIDGRERYKMQRNRLLNPPKQVEPAINIIDDNVTNISFDAILSELDIVNLHTKKDYLEKLINQTILKENKDLSGSDCNHLAKPLLHDEKPYDLNDGENEAISCTEQSSKCKQNLIEHEEFHENDTAKRDNLIKDDHGANTFAEQISKSEQDLIEPEEFQKNYDAKKDNLNKEEKGAIGTTEQSSKSEQNSKPQEEHKSDEEKIDKLNKDENGANSTNEQSTISKRKLKDQAEEQKNSSYGYRQSKKPSKKRRKSEFDIEIDGLVSVKKIKKQHIDQVKTDNDDDYVLSKLFAKSGVQSALEHDKIIGLAEKEERHRLKEEASKTAKKALRAIKKSVKRKYVV